MVKLAPYYYYKLYTGYKVGSDTILLHLFTVPAVQVGAAQLTSTIPLPCTVRKMGLILRSRERMLKMQFIMALNFMLQPLRRYGVKPPEKTAQA